MILLSAIMLGLLLAFGARLLVSLAPPPQPGTARPIRLPFWRMMLLRACMVALFAAMYYFSDAGDKKYHGYPEVADSWGGACVVVIVAILADAIWAVFTIIGERRTK